MSPYSDPTSPTALDPPLCGVCPLKATITCRTCDNMKYCSTECQEADAPVHNTLCSSFVDFRSRPSPYHYRAILFDAFEIRPKFIWLLIDGVRGCQDVNQDEWSRYCTGRRNSAIMITSHLGFSPPRQYDHRILVEHDEDTLEEGLPINRCLIMLCGTQVQRFRGNFVARGYKYTDDTTPEQRDRCDHYIPGACHIAIDLDTMSLNPLLAWFPGYVGFEQRCITFQQNRYEDGT